MVGFYVSGMGKMLKSVAFHTLGCKLNFAETSTLARQFENAGYERKEIGEDADLIVINTCSVTENADKEFRKIVNRATRHAPQARVAVIGCYAQLQPDVIASHERVDLVLGTQEKFNLLHHVHGLEDVSTAEMGEKLIQHGRLSNDLECVPAVSMGDRTRSFLKIQDGCDYPCTYCTIPLARGKSRSLPLKDIATMVDEVVQAEVKEVVLTGVNVGEYANAQGDRLIDVLKLLEATDGIERVRISSIEPNLLTDEILEFAQSSHTVLPHFHIPLQSGSNRVLKRMKRRYPAELYRDRVAAIETRFPYFGLGSDVIVGFPGEGDEEFQETLELLKATPLTYLHVFTYSERPDTQAIALNGTVPMEVRKQRNRVLSDLSQRKQAVYALSQLNRKRHVLFESLHDGVLTGMTEDYQKVFVESTDFGLINTIQPVELTMFHSGKLTANLL